MRMKWIVAAVLAVGAPAVAEHKVAVEQQVDGATADMIVKRHIAALGGAKLLRAGKSITFTVTGEKMGKKFTKTVVQARPNLMRVDIQSDEGAFSKGFDGKVAWMKKGADAAVAMSPDETASMKAHADFEEPLLDYAKKGTKVTLVGKAEVNQMPAYDLEVAFKSGETEHHFIDAQSYVLVKRVFTMKEKDGKTKQMSVRFGDYKKVQGRMVNHSVEWDGDDGKTARSVVSNIAYDKPVNAKLFAMPK